MTVDHIRLQASYDDIADVMYVTSSQGANTQNCEEEAGLVLRYDAETHRPVGATIIDYKEYWLPQRPHLLDSLSRFLGISLDDAKNIIRSAPL